MLILGESHYDLPEREVPEYTCKWVRDYAEHGKTNRFFTVVTKLFLGLPNGSSPSSDERSAFWQRVAFHNYIQSFPGERARLRPTAAMWADAARCLPRVLERLEPEFVLVLGKALNEHLPVWTCGAIVCVTPHPSSFGFRHTQWGARVRESLRSRTSRRDIGP